MIVLRDWVIEQSLAIQGTIMTGVRGPDGCPKEDPAKEIVQAFRWATMNNAHEGMELDCEFCSCPEDECHRCGGLGTYLAPKPGDTFMGDWTGMTRFAVVKEFLKGHDQYPHHWLMHLVHCAEIIGYLHPNDMIREWWCQFYLKICNAFHMNPETQGQMICRLTDRREVESDG